MKKYLINLKHIFAFRNYYRQCYLVVIFIISLIYSLVTNQYYLLVINLLLLILVIKNKALFYLLIIILIITSIRIVVRNFNFNQLVEGEIKAIAKVYQVENYQDYQKVYLKIRNGKYYFISEERVYHSGDRLQVNGIISKVSRSNTPNGFDYQQYLKYQNIFGKITLKSVKILSHQFSLNSLHESVSMYIYQNYDSSYSGMLAALLIGNKDQLDDDLQKQINQIGISHLFVISGLHIEVISKTLFVILDKLRLKKRFQNSLIFLVLLFYYLLTSFMVSILRVLISFIFQSFLKKQLRPITIFDRFFLNVVIVLLINPYYLFSYSFILSYLIVFGILLIQKKLKQGRGFKSFIYNNLMISTTSTLISLPIIVNISNEINFLSIIYNLFFIPLITYLILPFSFLTIIIPPLKNIYQYLYAFFRFLTSFCSKLELLTITFPKPSFIIIFIYYLVFLLLIWSLTTKIKLRLVALFLLVIVVWLIQPYLQITNEIHFLSLPTGDATLISTNHQQTNILIDTGDCNAEELVVFLKRKGIRTIDGVIISHGDSDHIGGLASLIDEFKINNVYVGVYDQTSIEYVSHLQKIKMHLVKAGDVIKFNRLVFNVLFPIKDYHNINNNSLVIMAKLFNISILFTGDIEQQAELDLVRKYPHLHFDLLKVAHHGSNTSSSMELLKSYQFKYAIAMNGYSNQFGFPAYNVVRRYQDLIGVKMYNTIDYGTITLIQNPINKKIRFSFSYEKN